jgi:hypothetical protein
MNSSSSFRPRNLYWNGWKTIAHLERDFGMPLADVARQRGIKLGDWHSRSKRTGDRINR